MPRVMVVSDQTKRFNGPVLLDERVESVHLSDDHSTMQLIERLGWAIADAEDAEHAQLHGRARRPCESSHPRARHHRRDGAARASVAEASARSHG